MVCFDVSRAVSFVLAFVRKILFFSARSDGLVCSASNLILEILKHDKICGTICISVPSLQIFGDWPPCLPVSTPTTESSDDVGPHQVLEYSSVFLGLFRSVSPSRVPSAQFPSPKCD